MLTEPKQERSRRSLDLLLESASCLVAERGFEAMSLRDLCAHAGLTSGAFYARFSKKEDLGLALAERLGEECLDLVVGFSDRLEEDGFDEAVHALLQDSIDLYRRRGGLFRAVIAMARSHPQVARSMQRINNRMFADLLEALAPYRARLDHAAPERAFSLGFFAVLNALRELVLEQQLFKTDPVPLDDEVLVQELELMLLSYLRLSPIASAPTAGVES